jgi:sugar/nucleoside kinase (ribokinase family)
MQRRGVTAGGLFIVDHTKVIDHYPEPEALAEISERRVGNGGGAFNLLIDLARLGAPFPLEAVGRVGQDADGRWIVERCRSFGIATLHLRAVADVATSFTDVMTERQSGRRTFFHQRGANALLEIEDFGLSESASRLLYLGYPMLLDRLDAPHPSAGVRAAELLRRARALGLTTCVDFVTAPRERFAGIVPAILRHTDLCLMNELEAERATGIRLRVDGRLQAQRLDQAAQALLALGVHTAVVLHFPEGAVALTADGERAAQGSVLVPAERIAGTAGAGDAFAAGFLLSWHEGRSLAEGLLAGAAVAATCLLDPTTSDGLRPLGACLALARELGQRPAP